MIKIIYYFLEKCDRMSGFLALLGCVIAVVGFVGCSVYYASVNEPEWQFVSLLYSIPLIQVWILFLLWRTLPSAESPEVGGAKTEKNLIGLYSVLTILGVGFCCLYWFLYSYEISSLYPGGIVGMVDRGHFSSFWLKAFSWSALFFACMLAVLTLGLAWILICPQIVSGSGGRFGVHDRTKKAIQRHPFASLCFFLALLLSITYLLGFSFSFHDLDWRVFREQQALFSYSRLAGERDSAGIDANGGSAVLQEVQPDSLHNGGDNIEKERGALKEADEQEEEVKEEESADVEVYMLFFEESLAAIDLDESQGVVFVQDKGGSYVHKKYTKNAREQKRLFRTIANNSQLDRMREKILQFVGQRLRVTVVGHASDKIISRSFGTYSSNYELSEHRVMNAIHELTEFLERGSHESFINIDWDPLPRSNKGPRLVPRPREDLAIFEDEEARRLLDPELAVEVAIKPVREDPAWVELRRAKLEHEIAKLHEDIGRLRYDPGRRLHLLDYMYFSIYTITTTGYGDIIPISGKSKFLASVSNFFEVFFLVVFFNVLLSMARTDQELDLSLVDSAGDLLRVPKGEAEGGKMSGHTSGPPDGAMELKGYLESRLKYIRELIRENRRLTSAELGAFKKELMVEISLLEQKASEPARHDRDE